ncbi:unnamed protein product [Euphydryas editha]|uniref:ATP-dependent DNA helicase n=1 Tax=Euphydryas editha TaxID=104508 RepID=A0AAU9UKS7_EUPED|nr:unnamed protein product [Euphydryas editha]
MTNPWMVLLHFFCDDFRQILPVIKRGTRTETSYQVYGNVTEIATYNNSWLCERAISIDPVKRPSGSINAEILSFVSGDNVEYISINRVIEEEESADYPVEFLETVNAGS